MTIEGAWGGPVDEGRGTPRRSGAGWVRRLSFLLAFSAGLLRVQAGWTTYGESELAATGDFDGDSRIDLVVVDRNLGWIRVGYQESDGTLSWSAPRSGGINTVSGIATGRLLGTQRDVLAVTGAEANGVWLLDLSARVGALVPQSVSIQGIGPDGLVSVPQGAGQQDALLVGSGENGGVRPQLVEQVVVNGGVPTIAFKTGLEDRFSDWNPLDLPALTEVPVMAMRRPQVGGWAWTLFSRSGGLVVTSEIPDLPPGVFYVAGTFSGGSALVLGMPGASSLSVYPITVSGGVATLAAERTIGLGRSIQSVSRIGTGSSSLLWVVFAPGNQAALYDWTASDQWVVRQQWTLPAGEKLGGAWALGSSSLVVLQGEAFGESTRYSVWSRNGQGYVQSSSGGLSSWNGTDISRANLWFYEGEPFVTSQARFAGTRRAGDWTLSLSGLPGAVTASAATDRGTSSGLGAPSAISVGAPPTGATHALVNQYRPAISFFSYEPAGSAGGEGVRFSPAPGRYASNVVLSLSPAVAGQNVFYRLGGTQSWTRFFSPITLSNETLVSAYATPVGGSPRSSLQQARYILPDARAALTADPNYNPGTGGGGGGDTNQPPIDPVVLSSEGTLFYERWNQQSELSIWAIDLDGTGDRFVTRGHIPRVSPDGRWLAFQREGSPLQARGNLWMRDLQTGVERRVFSNGDFLVGHSFSPDSTTLLFDYLCGQYGTGVQEGAAVNGLGFSYDCYDDAPALSPDGTRLMWHNHNPSPQAAGLWLGSVADKTRTRVLDGELVPGWPVWSPDGRYVAFIRDTAEASPARNVYVMTPDGGEVHQITAFRDAPDGFFQRVTWTPEGDGLIAAGSVGRVNGLWVITLTDDKSACALPPRRLATSPGQPILGVGDWARSRGTVSPADLNLQIFRVGEDATVLWNSTLGLLETAPSLEGPWTSRPELQSPYVEPLATSAQKFYRARAR